MDLFESQVEARRRFDDERLEQALHRLSDAVTGARTAEGASRLVQAGSALDHVLAYYGVEGGETPRGVKSMDELIQQRLRSTGIMCRPVRLSGAWYRDAMGAMLGFADDGLPVALIPLARGGYQFIDGMGPVRVNERSAKRLADEAWCFYRPLPQRELGVRDILLFMARSLDRGDIIALICAAAASTALGMVAPLVNRIVFGPVVEAGTASIIAPLAVLLVGVLVAQVIVGGIRQIVLARISTKLSVPLDAAMMMRTLSLPASFFSRYQTGDLSERLAIVGEVGRLIQDVVLTALLNALFAMAYVGQIAAIAPAMALPTVGVALLTTAVTALVAAAQMRVTARRLDLGTRLSGWQYALIEGLQKIKLVGAEKRAFATWANLYHRQARLTYNGPLLTRLSSTIQMAVASLGTIVFYLSAAAGGLSVAEYMAFTSAYGAVSAALAALGAAAVNMACIRPYLSMADPLLKTVPETSESKRALERMSGGFELNHVTFAYGDDRPVLEDLTLKVRPGEYVAVVGKTGCGKSTLMRLLLGFERPQRGAVYYDGRDLASVDAGSVRKRIGVVLQDGRLFAGSIYDNIAISAPGLTLEQAWEAAELAGLSDDIDAMPMGMNTMVTEGGGGMSGGQRQRIMIARAIAARPKILMFDEATSALDNMTQKIVSDSLESLKCTRLVIAHRLSTIRACSRIVVLDGGRIVEDGTYDELVERGGLFADLVARQQV
ncbi:NHLP family bacteriocin export ABC transporter permease/ATPase subunit [Collinsella sp. An271]|uniref:ATP-binding cassette domain-containing protein n=1 Tax=Collinsella sp. An271 TaxID=1965616 RepID=UPI000B383894|nr:ATP-binding cassette domain-containing protein [Collinsella sp. An271]OUO61725.1 NHLP family bacteriocin export ABC transporter permease/ATPase subunit [Collinsella sp. An271]